MERKGYFINPELKRSSALLLGSMVVFLLLSCAALKLQHDSMKRSYISSVGGMAARIVEKQPELEPVIMPVLTGTLSEAESEKGRALLADYGITEGLEASLFPYVNRTMTWDYMMTFIIFLLMGTVLFLMNYLQHGFFYKRIRNLTFAARRVVDGEYDINIDEDREGDLSKLASSFNSMRGVIRGNLHALREDKRFLADILSDISHQLKTPLASVILYNDIMLSKELTAEQQKTFLTNNQNQLSRMSWLIKNLLKLAKLDAKAMELTLAHQSLNGTIHDAMEALEGKAQEKNVVMHFDDEVEVEFAHDRYWFEEALINILKNGIEHTGEGGQIRISLMENSIYRRITIEDNGEGIAEDDLPHIFKRFFKVKGARKNDSVGIGLALSKAIVEAHNGIIEVRSEPGVGTTFIITVNKY